METFDGFSPISVILRSNSYLNNENHDNYIKTGIRCSFVCGIYNCTDIFNSCSPCANTRRLSYNYQSSIHRALIVKILTIYSVVLPYLLVQVHSVSCGVALTHAGLTHLTRSSITNNSHFFCLAKSSAGSDY